MRRRSLIIAFPIFCISVGILLLTSCTPAWLPDSSGFVFIRSGGQVALFDVEKKSSRDITTLTSPWLVRPAISPDGKQIGLLRHSGKGIEVVLYDLSGRLTHRSPPFHDSTMTGEAKQDGGVYYWSPDGKRLVCTYAARGGEGGILVYHIADRSFRHFPRIMPIGSLTMLVDKSRLGYDVSPISPDSKGFLAYQEPGPQNDSPFIYWEWDAEEPKSLAMSEAVKNAGGNKDRDKTIGVRLPPFWQKRAFFMAVADRMIKIDCDAMKVNYEDDERMAKLLAHAERKKLQVVAIMADGAIVELTPENVIQVWQPKTDETKPVTQLPDEKNPGGAPSVAWLTPSPNNRLAIVQLATLPARFVVFDSSGRLVAKIDR